MVAVRGTSTATDNLEVVATDQTDQVLTASTLDHDMKVSTEEPVLEFEHLYHKEAHLCGTPSQVSNGPVSAWRVYGSVCG
jgi:hypothetical protein